MGDETDAAAVDYPRFDHGEDLYVAVVGDEAFEFRSTALGEYVRADNAVYLADEA